MNILPVNAIGYKQNKAQNSTNCDLSFKGSFIGKIPYSVEAAKRLELQNFLSEEAARLGHNDYLRLFSGQWLSVIENGRGPLGVGGVQGPAKLLDLSAPVLKIKAAIKEVSRNKNLKQQ